MGSPCHSVVTGAFGDGGDVSEGIAVQDWDDVKRWRKAQRADLIAGRQAISQGERRRLQPLILDLVENHFSKGLESALVGFYWPFRGEIGPHALIRRLIEHGAGAALPVVVEKNRPLEFWDWRPGQKLGRGVWDIPIPAERSVVQPTALLVPLVGFDGNGYRLGYGGGYYDRTLAAMERKPFTIGLGYELGRLSTIHPQPHDIQMDVVVTETGVFRSPPRRSLIADDDPDALGSYASPPCFMHELDPSYAGLPPRHDGDDGTGERDDEGPASRPKNAT